MGITVGVVRVALQGQREPMLLMAKFVAEVIPKRTIHERLRSCGFATCSSARPLDWTNSPDVGKLEVTSAAHSVTIFQASDQFNTGTNW